MKSQLAKVSISTLALALLVYSATRSVDLIRATLPPGQQVLAWFGLAALDIGLILWLAQFLFGASGEWQRAVALAMVAVDFLGAVVLFSADTFYRAGQAGLIAALTPGQVRAVILTLSAIIALNIAATVISHVFDPESQKRIAAAIAQDKIESEALRLIHAQASDLATELAPMLADSWRNATKARYLLTLKRAKTAKLDPTLDLAELSSNNGRQVAYNEETTRPNVDLDQVRGRK